MNATTMLVKRELEEKSVVLATLISAAEENVRKSESICERATRLRAVGMISTENATNLNQYLDAARGCVRELRRQQEQILAMIETFAWSERAVAVLAASEEPENVSLLSIQ